MVMYYDTFSHCSATHSGILAWRIPWTEESGRLQSVGLQSQILLKQLSMHALSLLWVESSPLKLIRWSRNPQYLSMWPLLEMILFKGSYVKLPSLAPMCSVASVVPDSVTLWTIVRQSCLSMRCFRQDRWSGQPLLSPGGLLDPGIKLGFPALQENSLQSEPPGKP